MTQLSFNIIKSSMRQKILATYSGLIVFLIIRYYKFIFHFHVKSIIAEKFFRALIEYQSEKWEIPDSKIIRYWVHILRAFLSQSNPLHIIYSWLQIRFCIFDCFFTNVLYYWLLWWQVWNFIVWQMKFNELS